jgi:tetratricopeptide (TPR) repeat protein
VSQAVEQEIRALRAHFWSSRDPEGRAFAPLADAYRRKGDLKEAASLVEDGLARLPGFTPGHLVAARIARARGDLERARHSLDRLLELDGQNVLALLERSEVARDTGDTEAAMEDLSHLLALDPGHLGARAALDRLESASQAPSMEPKESGAHGESGAVASEAAVGGSVLDEPQEDDPTHPLMDDPSDPIADELESDHVQSGEDFSFGASLEEDDPELDDESGFVDEGLILDPTSLGEEIALDDQTAPEEAVPEEAPVEDELELSPDLPEVEPAPEDTRLPEFTDESLGDLGDLEGGVSGLSGDDLDEDPDPVDLADAEAVDLADADTEDLADADTDTATGSSTDDLAVFDFDLDFHDGSSQSDPSKEGPEAAEGAGPLEGEFQPGEEEHIAPDVQPPDTLEVQAAEEEKLAEEEPVSDQIQTTQEEQVPDQIQAAQEEHASHEFQLAEGDEAGDDRDEELEVEEGGPFPDEAQLRTDHEAEAPAEDEAEAPAEAEPVDTDSQVAADVMGAEDTAEAMAEVPSHLLTRTMAEIFQQQGLTDRAIQVYEALVDRHPRDEELRARLEELQSAPTSEAAPIVSEQAAPVSGAPDDADAKQQAPQELEPEEDRPAETPFAWDDEPVEETSTRTIRDHFDDLLSWAPGAIPIGDLSPDADPERAPADSPLARALAAPPSTAPAEDEALVDDDLDDFRSWLKSLDP